MRISTNTIYESGTARLGDLQSDLVKLQQQLSTGRRILSPSDDPVAAARALEITQAQSVNTQFSNNRQTVKSQLSITESTLSNISDLLTSVQSTLVSAGNGTYSDTQRGFLAVELRGNLDELFGLANATDGAGNRLFSGYQTKTAPFAPTATGAQYNGDQGQRMVQVSVSRQMAVSETGDNIFLANGQDVFKTMTDLINLLETPVTTPAASAALSAGLATASAGLQGAADAVLTVRASMGSRLKELDALDVSGQDRDIQYAQALSDFQSLDYTKAISQLSQQQMTLEAAQKSFVKVVGLSLFNLI